MRVDCTLDEGRDLCIQFKIKGYPSILLLKHNHYYKYKGDRSAMSIIDFANDKYSQAEIQGIIPPKVVNPQEEILKTEKR